MGQARTGPVRESTGLALARTNPMVPMVARTNPAWDQSGLAIWEGTPIYGVSLNPAYVWGDLHNQCKNHTLSGTHLVFYPCGALPLWNAYVTKKKTL